MALKMDRDIKRVTLVGSGRGGTNTVYRRDHHDDDEDGAPIKRVTVVKRDDRGRTVYREAYEAEPRRKRGSRALHPLERGVREFLQFENRVIDNYLDRHARSNEKHRDGWILDMPGNMMRAVRKSKPQRLVRVSRYTRDDD